MLAGIAELAEEIDTDRAQVAHDAAEARVAELASAGRTSESGAEDEVDAEVVEAEAALRRSEVRLEAAGVTAAAGS